MPGAVRAVGTELFEGYVNVNRRKNTTPFRIERPWTKPLASGQQRVDVKAEDRAQRDRLDRMLGLVRDADADEGPPPDDE